MRGIAVVTDSGAMLPDYLIAGHDILVAPLNVIVDGHGYADGIDIDADELYDALLQAPVVSASNPTPERMLDCYRRAAERGAREIISIHVSSAMCTTVESARAAAKHSPVPVTVVDSLQGSFGEGLCVLEAIDAINEGRSVDEAAERARAAGQAVRGTFVLHAEHLPRNAGSPSPRSNTVASLHVVEENQPSMIGFVKSVSEAVDRMVEYVGREAASAAARHASLRIGIGQGAAPIISSALHAAVEALPGIGEIHDFVVGPTMGIYHGRGNAGAIFVARPVA